MADKCQKTNTSTLIGRWQSLINQWTYDRRAIRIQHYHFQQLQQQQQQQLHLIRLTDRTYRQLSVADVMLILIKCT